MNCSLIISTYNWPEALEIVLISAQRQTILPKEILIADDGSKNETSILIEKFKKKLSVPIIHVWHEDKGFRKSEILNKSYALAKEKYIVQIDGDIIMHKNFIKDHLKNAQEKVFLHGSRCFLNKTLTEKAINDKITSFFFLKKGLKNKFNSLYIPIIAKFIKPNKSIKRTRGCNFSCYKNDFILVNGYNEDMTGWGKEDTELSTRLINNNIYKKHLKGCAITYHLEHKKLSRDGFNKNIEILNNTISNNIKSCKNGVKKYLNE